MARARQRFTIYDMMEQKGVFEANPANVDARDSEGNSTYLGPVAYPKMLYHPTGERRVTVPTEIISTPFGPKEVGQQTEIIWQLVRNAEDEKKLTDAGWHFHPARAIAAAGGVAPPLSADQRIKELEAQLAALQAKPKASDTADAGSPLGKMLTAAPAG